MRFAVRSRPTVALPGVHGTARVHRRIASLLPRLRPGDVAVVDHLDLDRATAQALVDTGVAGVVSAGPLISGRYPTQGPQVLVEAGVVVVDQAGEQVLTRIRDGAPVRLHDGVVHLGEDAVVAGRALDAERVQAEMDAARQGLSAQLESLTHNTTELLRREQDLLLHGHGVPRTATGMAGRPVVVVVRSHGWEAELAGLRAFIREQDPVLVAVDHGASALASAGLRPDVVVVSATSEDLPPADVLRRARDVVVLLERGAPRSATEPFERMNLRPVRFEAGTTTEDAALLLSAVAEPSLIVGVGMHATLDDFLDRQRSGLASTFLTRLKVGSLLVDAALVPALYDGAVRPRHLLGAVLAGLFAVGAAVSTTAVGQEWGADLWPLLTSAFDSLRGLLP